MQTVVWFRTKIELVIYKTTNSFWSVWFLSYFTTLSPICHLSPISHTSLTHLSPNSLPFLTHHSPIYHLWLTHPSLSHFSPISPHFSPISHPSLTNFFFIIVTTFVEFIYSEKATKFCEISTLLLSYVVPVKSKVEILQNFVAYSEYMNFTHYT